MESSLNSLAQNLENLTLNSSPNKSETSSSTKTSSKKSEKIGFCFDERMLLHRDSKHIHQECPERAMSVYINLVLKELTSKLVRIPCEEAKEEDILLVHTKEYYDKIKNISENCKDKNITNHNLSEKDSYDNFATFESATLATGGLLNICKNILSNKIKHGYAIIRPPGHHADMSNAKGFCIFNNVAIAVKTILKKYPEKKICILDWDVHHGDGTQAIFYKDNNPLFLSIHRHDKGKFYPFKTGFVNEHGEEKGNGFNINIPLDTKCNISKGASCIGDAEYINIFDKIIMPILYEYNPDIIFISCGYDAGENDFSGCLRCTPLAYAFMTQKLLQLNKNLIFALEGGYTLDTIKRCSETTIRTLLGEDIPWKNNMIENYKLFNESNNFNMDYLMNNYQNIFKIVPYVAQNLNDVINEHKKFWKCLNEISIKEKYKTNNNEFILNKDIISNEENIKNILSPFLIQNEPEFHNSNEEFIVIKIGENLVNTDKYNNIIKNQMVQNNDTNYFYKKLILGFRLSLPELKFNIEGVKFTKLRANATKISQLLNWNRSEMKYDMSSNIISEILMLFFQNLKMKNKEFLKSFDAFIKNIKEKFGDNLDLYNCDLVIIPKVIKNEEKDGKEKSDSKKKFKLVNKRDKIELKFYINGINNKNLCVYSEDKGNNKHNFIKGLEGFRKFINESVMN